MWGELDRAPLTVTAPISNGPTTTRLHHYAGHYWRGGPCQRYGGGRYGCGAHKCRLPRRIMAGMGVMGEMFCDAGNSEALTSAMGGGAVCQATVDRRDASGRDRSNVACNSID